MRKVLFASLLASAAIFATSQAALVKSYDVGTESGAEFEAAKAVDCPCPKIPEEMKDCSMQCCCEAKFSIDEVGKSKVKLVKSSGSDEIDDITLTTLRRWKFKPAMLDGKPVASTRRIKVNYEVD